SRPKSAPILEAVTSKRRNASHASRLTIGIRSTVMTSSSYPQERARAVTGYRTLRCQELLDGRLDGDLRRLETLGLLHYDDGSPEQGSEVFGAGLFAAVCFDEVAVRQRVPDKILGQLTNILGGL